MYSLASFDETINSAPWRPLIIKFDEVIPFVSFGETIDSARGPLAQYLPCAVDILLLFKRQCLLDGKLKLILSSWLFVNAHKRR